MLFSMAAIHITNLSHGQLLTICHISEIYKKK